MTEPLEMLADAATVMRNESQRAHSKLAARENFGFKFTLAKENPLPYLNLAAGPNKRLPRLGIELAGEEDFDSPSQMFGSRGARWRLRMDARTPPEQAGRNDARIVEDEELVASQEAGEFSEYLVFEKPCGTIHEEKPGGFASVERPLRDLLSGEMVVELVQAHGKRQSSSKTVKAHKTS